MKKIVYISFITSLLGCIVISCKKKDNDDSTVPEPEYAITQAYNLTDVAYGSDPKQNMDVYLPANRDGNSTKVFVMIHGGGWTSGDKSDYASTMSAFKSYYPNHAIININYRLGVQGSPGYPKQINDIQAALNEIQKEKYNLSKNICFMAVQRAGIYRFCMGMPSIRIIMSKVLSIRLGRLI